MEFDISGLWKFPYISQQFKLDVILKLYGLSTLNIDLILWQTQLIVCAKNVKSWFKSKAF